MVDLVDVMALKKVSGVVPSGVSRLLVDRNPLLVPTITAFEMESARASQRISSGGFR